MLKENLQIKLVDKKIKLVNRFSVPEDGWIALARSMLGITKAQLAKKLKISPQRLGVIEKGEKGKTVKLKTLVKVANELNCNLYYCFVPKYKTFEKLLEAKIDAYVEKKIQAIQKTMQLESQGISKGILSVQKELLKKEIYVQGLKDIWND